MRFLLHATKKVKSRSSVKSSRTAAAALGENSTSENTAKSWGQQCSPNCGCVLRFESTLDCNNVITSASYQAKTILTYVENGQRQAHFTTTNQNKPLVKECSCKTLHSLAQTVITHLPGKRVDQVVNSLSGSTSAAVVHASLKTQQLPTTHSSCFHLMQQALVAMLCGYLPKQSVQSYHQYLRQNCATTAAEDEDDMADGYGVDENSGISVRAAMDILDMTYDTATTVEEEEEEQDEQELKSKPKRLTWEDYVDELYHQYDDANGNGVQRSA